MSSERMDANIQDVFETQKILPHIMHFNVIYIYIYVYIPDIKTQELWQVEIHYQHAAVFA